MAAENEIFEIDQNLLHDFLVESMDILSGLEPLFVQFEADPDNHALIDSIFRPIHSVKGNSAFFGLANIKGFSHALENLLQDVRSHTRRATPEIIDVLLRGSDALRLMVHRRMDGNTSIELLPEEETLLAEVTSIRDSSVGGIAELLGPAVAASEALHEKLEDPACKALLESIDKALHAILAEMEPDEAKKINGGRVRYFLGDADLTESIQRMSDFVENLIQQCQEPALCMAFLDAMTAIDRQAAGHNLPPVTESLASLRTDFQTIHESGIGFDELLASLIKEKFDHFVSTLDVRTGPREDAAAAPAAETAAPAEARPTGGTENDSARKTPAPVAEDSARKTIRIDEEKVDSFMHFVGELIVTGEVFSYIQKRLSGIEGAREIAGDFKKANIAFSELSINLQKSLMEVRRVPLKNVFQMFPRMVRDLARQLGKQVQLEMEGQMVQLDKSILEKLEAPLTHMIRNSVDHGIEMPDKRAAAGKAPMGTVRLKAEGTENMVIVTITDDGGGIPLAKIRAAAVSKGVVTPEKAAQMSDQDVRNLIFHPGFSTAEKVTDVSGRGVGMDVVNTNIQEVNGTVSVASEEGKGTTITLTLPQAVTLMVVDGLVARVGTETYIVPLKKVSESLRPQAADISTVKGQGTVVNVRGRLYPLVRLHEVLGQKGEHNTVEDGVIIIVESDAGACGLLVDDLLGQQSVVLKDLSAFFGGLHIIRGGAILGDGRVGLVLDLDGIIGQYAVPPAK